MIFIFYYQIRQAPFAFAIFLIALTLKQIYYFDIFISSSLKKRRDKAFYYRIAPLSFRRYFMA